MRKQHLIKIVKEVYSTLPAKPKPAGIAELHWARTSFSPRIVLDSSNWRNDWKNANQQQRLTRLFQRIIKVKNKTNNCWLKLDKNFPYIGDVYLREISSPNGRKPLVMLCTNDYKHELLFAIMLRDKLDGGGYQLFCENINAMDYISGDPRNYIPRKLTIKTINVFQQLMASLTEVETMEFINRQ